MSWVRKLDRTGREHIYEDSLLHSSPVASTASLMLLVHQCNAFCLVRGRKHHRSGLHISFWARKKLLPWKQGGKTLKTSTVHAVYYTIAALINSSADSFCDKASESDISGSSLLLWESHLPQNKKSLLIFWACLRLLTKRPVLHSHYYFVGVRTLIKIPLPLMWSPWHVFEWPKWLRGGLVFPNSRQ